MCLAQIQAATGFTVPQFKAHSAGLFEEVGVALAQADEARLQRLTTPSCFETMRPALRSRPKGQRHSWTSHGVVSSIKQIRVGFSSSDRERKFAQVTCAIEAQMVYEIHDTAGKLVGSTGSAATPHSLTDIWVFERMLAPGGAWRLKERLGSLEELSEASCGAAKQEGAGASPPTGAR